MRTKKNKLKRVVIVPTYNRVEFLRPCLENLAMMSDEWDHLIIMDNNSDSTVKNAIDTWHKRMKEIGNDVDVVWLQENEGKASAVNKAVDMFVDDDSIICSLDSDIRVYAMTLQNCFSTVEVNRTPTILCAQQDGANCHLYSPNSSESIVDIGNNIKVRLLQVPNGRGVAGGCLFIRSNMFKKMGGYNEGMGVYGGNESGLYARFNNRKYGIFVAPDLSVFHPPENNDDYQAWKDSCQNSIRSTGVCGKDKGYFE
jgi:GT2 family glycosyltransferase